MGGGSLASPCPGWEVAGGGPGRWTQGLALPAVHLVQGVAMAGTLGPDVGRDWAPVKKMPWAQAGPPVGQRWRPPCHAADLSRHVGPGPLLLCSVPGLSALGGGRQKDRQAQGNPKPVWERRCQLAPADVLVTATP